MTASAYGPYSPVRHAGNYFFISGQIGSNPETKHADPDIAAQTAQAMDNLMAALASCGLKASDVVKTTVFLIDMADFTTVNKIYMSYFNEPRPARSCVEVAGLPVVSDTELMIEIEAVAYKADREVSP